MIRLPLLIACTMHRTCRCISYNTISSRNTIDLYLTNANAHPNKLDRWWWLGWWCFYVMLLCTLPCATRINSKLAICVIRHLYQSASLALCASCCTELTETIILGIGTWHCVYYAPDCWSFQKWRSRHTTRWGCASCMYKRVYVPSSHLDRRINFV